MKQSKGEQAGDKLGHSLSNKLLQCHQMPPPWIMTWYAGCGACHLSFGILCTVLEFKCTNDYGAGTCIFPTMGCIVVPGSRQGEYCTAKVRNNPQSHLFEFNVVAAVSSVV